MTRHKQYLGDGVYIDVDQFGQFVLTTEDGIETTNIIYLEPDIALTLVRYITTHQSLV